jgi:hypothetical protein
MFGDLEIVIGGDINVRPYHADMTRFATRVGLTVAALGSLAIAAQTPEIRPSWKDLETWTRYDETTRETEAGLGLQPPGPTGAVALAFTARVPGRTVRPVATQVTVVVAMGALFNSTVIRNPTLTFLIDEGQPKWSLIDLSPRFIGNELAPTTRLTSGIARISPDEYLRLTRAKGTRANILGAEIVFSRAQLDAMRAFARRTLPPSK